MSFLKDIIDKQRLKKCLELLKSHVATSVNGQKPDKNGAVNISIGVESVDGITPDEAGNVKIPVASDEEVAAGETNEKYMTPANTLFAINKRTANYYNSVEAMKADRKLKAGMTACTLGYYAINDGGGATYIIRATQESDVNDGGSLHELANGNVAELMVENGTVNVKQFGAKGDGVTDDTDAIQKAINFASTVIINNICCVAQTINIYKNIYITGRGAIYHPSSDKTQLVFYVNAANINVVIDGLSFQSVRDNKVIVPAGHEGSRPNDSFNSNIIGVLIQKCDTCVVKNCNFNNIEYAIKTTAPSQSDVNTYMTADKIILYNCVIKNPSMGVYISNTNVFVSDTVTIDMYQKIGTGEHCYYISYNTVDSYIVNQKLIANTEPSGGYIFHFYAPHKEVYPTRALIDNVVVMSKGHTYLGAFFTKESVIMSNIIAQLTSTMTASNLLVTNALLEDSPDLTGNITLENSKLRGINLADGNYVIKNCELTSPKSCVYSAKNTTLEMTNCKCISSNSDGTFSFRNDNIKVNISHCSIYNSIADYLFYNNKSAPLLNVYFNEMNCANIARDYDNININANYNILNAEIFN